MCEVGCPADACGIVYLTPPLPPPPPSPPRTLDLQTYPTLTQKCFVWSDDAINRHLMSLFHPSMKSQTGHWSSLTPGRHYYRSLNKGGINHTTNLPPPHRHLYRNTSMAIHDRSTPPPPLRHPSSFTKTKEVSDDDTTLHQNKIGLLCYHALVVSRDVTDEVPAGSSRCRR